MPILEEEETVNETSGVVLAAGGAEGVALQQQGWDFNMGANNPSVPKKKNGLKHDHSTLPRNAVSDFFADSLSTYYVII